MYRSLSVNGDSAHALAKSKTMPTKLNAPRGWYQYDTIFLEERHAQRARARFGR